jgi:Lysylphosphatidylglycerol synthase TM region
MFADTLQLVGSTAETLVGRLAGVSFVLLAAALVLHVGKLAARARAWHNIARAAYPDESLLYRDSLGAYLSGVGLNAVLPARPGEVLKLTLVTQKAPGTTYRGLAATLLTESAFDTVIGAALLAIGLAIGWTSIGSPALSLLGPPAVHPWLALAVLLAAALGCFAAWRPLRRKLRGAGTEVMRGFAAFGHPRRFLRTVASWQLTALALRLASIYCFLGAFHIPAGMQTTMIVLAVQSTANLIPLTPNGAGTQQALLVLALGGAASASTIVRFGAGAQIATACCDIVLALAALMLMTGSLRWRRLIKAKAEAAAAAMAGAA